MEQTDERPIPVVVYACKVQPEEKDVSDPHRRVTGVRSQSAEGGRFWSAEPFGDDGQRLPETAARSWRRAMATPAKPPTSTVAPSRRRSDSRPTRARRRSQAKPVTARGLLRCGGGVTLRSVRDDLYSTDEAAMEWRRDGQQVSEDARKPTTKRASTGARKPGSLSGAYRSATWSTKRVVDEEASRAGDRPGWPPTSSASSSWSSPARASVTRRAS